MRPFVFGTALSLGLGMLAGSASIPHPASQEEASPWITDYGAAQAAARKSGKPIFLVFR